MGSTRGNTMQVARLGGNLSLLAAVFACLTLWSGITLLLNNPTQMHVSAPPADVPVLPRPVVRWEGVSPARRSLADLLLFWLPIGLGAVACGVGVLTLACGRECAPEASRRALIALLLGIVPGCLCALWYLAFAASPLVGR
jgi:hypothetical protein